MITEEQFAAIKRLIVSENCMIDRFEHYVSEIKEPQLKEDMQKLTAVSYTHLTLPTTPYV